MDGGARGLEGTAAVGAEEDEDGQLDSRLPAAIPWMGMQRATRRS